MENSPLLTENGNPNPIISDTDPENISAGSIKFEDDDVNADEKAPLHKGPPGKRGVNALQLTMMIYFFTSGGPFGIEAAVGGAGPLLTLISLVIIPLFWSLPQALMAAELSLMISENGGNVVWVRRAFGDFIGFFNAYNNIAQSISSLALLAILFELYIPLDLTIWQQWLARAGFILFNTVINLLGLRWISRLSVGFLVFVLSPFIVEFIIVLMRHELDINILNFIPPTKQIDWSLFLSTVIWSYGGFDSMGSLAGEVKGGRKTFLTGIVGSFPLIFINYFLPILFGYSIDRNYHHWVAGYFTNLSGLLNTRNQYLLKWMVASSALSNFGQFNAAMAPMARVIWATAKIGYLPSFLGWSWQRHTGTIRPIAAVVFVGIFTTACTAFSNNVLVQVFLMIRVFNLFCEYAALIRLRYSEPHTERPFVVPGGLVVVWLLGLPTMILAIFTLVNSNKLVWISGAVVNAFTLVCYLIRFAYLRFTSRKTRKHNQVN